MMRKTSVLFVTAALAIVAWSCSRMELTPEFSGPEAVEPQIESLPFITASLEDPDTRTSYEYTDAGVLKAMWAEGDTISVVPDSIVYSSAGLYVVDEMAGATATFSRVTGIGKTADVYGIYYPGKRIQSEAQFTRFSYSGQVQKKSDPLAHLGKYHSMKVTTSDYSNVSFAGGRQSACMRFVLSGQTFEQPVMIKLQSIGSSIFYSNNGYEGTIHYESGDLPEGRNSVDTLALSLEGYGTESSLCAYMMMSASDVTIPAGSTLRVWVVQADGKRYYYDESFNSEFKLSGGYCHTFSIDSGWTLAPGDYTAYDWDGEVVTLQTGSKNSLDLVIMGDGFIKEDFDNGTYDSIMRQAYSEFFSVEPLTTLKESFNVYYVKVPSPERVLAENTGLNGAQNTGHDTKLSAQFTANSTSITGNDDLAMEYAAKAFSTNASARLKDATIVVMVNQECHAGTC